VESLNKKMANDTSLQSQINTILELYSDGQIREALNDTESLIIKYPDESLLFNISGVCYKAIDQLQNAIKSFEKAVIIKPNFTDAYYNLGLTFQELNMLEAAVKSYEKAIEIEPKYAIVHNNLGIVFRELGQINDSINCYKKAIAAEPGFIEALNNLGNILRESDRLGDALKFYEEAIDLNPNFADAYNNIGIVLLEMGQSDDAIKFYKKALEIEPSYAEAHNNLGNAFKNIGQLDEAVKSYKLALKFEPDFVDVHNNLGVAYLSLRQLDKAVKSYKETLRLEPGFAEAQNNLGVTLKELGRLEEAEKFYRKAIELKPEYIEAMLNLSNLLDYMNNLDEAVLVLEDILEMDEGIYRLRAAINLAIFSFLDDDIVTSKNYLSEIQKTLDLDSDTYLIYWKYLLKILSSYENKPSDNLDFITKKKLYVIGESHSLVSHGLHFKKPSDDFVCKSLLIKGCMQWHLGNPTRNQYKNKFDGLFNSLPKSSEVLLSIGEIDCRLNSGIIKLKNKFPEKNTTHLISSTIENYINYINKINSNCEHKIIIQGIPCPNINTENFPKEKVIELVSLIREFNAVLKDKSTEIGFGFLDVYKLTNRGDGISNQSWHIDEYHLSPEGMNEAWRIHFDN
jgi:tetratricopeptide (TPR) repeat protein